MSDKNPQTRSERRQKKKKSNRGSKWRLVIGIVLILVALGLFALNPLKDFLIQQGIDTNSIGNLSREEIVANQQADVSYDFDQIEYIDPMSVIGNGVNPNDLPVVGGIAMPDVEMNLPIHKGTSNEGMYYGAGTLMPDQAMGQSNYSLASHHSSNPELLFAPLLEAEVGDTIYLTDLDRVYVYQVDTVETVPPTAVEVLNPTETPTVTLITCTYDLVNRVVVQGTLVDELPIAEASNDMLQAFDIPQTIAANN